MPVGEGFSLGGGWGEGRGKMEGEVTRVTLVGVGFERALCDFQIAFGGHLVEGVFAAAEEFAGVAMAVGRGLVSSLF